MPFFTFRQNNSGGSFDFDKELGITHFVVIEAPNAEAAKIEAIMHGLYFDGCEQGIDCSCCGDRWSMPWEGDGKDVPTLYGLPIGAPHENKFGITEKDWMYPKPEGVVHYANGRRQWFDSKGMPVDF